MTSNVLCECCGQPDGGRCRSCGSMHVPCVENKCEHCTEWKLQSGTARGPERYETVVDLAGLLMDVAGEVERAQRDHGRNYASDHEAFAVLLEEVEEVKAWVWKKRKDRDRAAMVRELVQIAAVSMKWASQLREAKS